MQLRLAVACRYQHRAAACLRCCAAEGPIQLEWCCSLAALSYQQTAERSSVRVMKDRCCRQAAHLATPVGSYQHVQLAGLGLEVYVPQDCRPAARSVKADRGHADQSCLLDC